MATPCSRHLVVPLEKALPYSTQTLNCRTLGEHCRNARNHFFDGLVPLAMFYPPPSLLAELSLRGCGAVLLRHWIFWLDVGSGSLQFGYHTWCGVVWCGCRIVLELFFFHGSACLFQGARSSLSWLERGGGGGYFYGPISRKELNFRFYSLEQLPAQNVNYRQCIELRKKIFIWYELSCMTQLAAHRGI